MNKIMSRELKESAKTIEALSAASESIAEAARTVIAAYKRGKKVLLIGNGGSAADAQHIAAELAGRFKFDRPGLPAIALTTDTSVLTALANDYGYENVFSRQVEALGSEKDVLIAITTSGASPNIIKAVKAARAKGVTVISMTGARSDHSELTGMSQVTIEVPSGNTPRIQEGHTTIGHIICLLVEENLFGQPSNVSR